MSEAINNSAPNASRDYQKCLATIKNAEKVLDSITSTLPKYDDSDWTAGLSKNEKIVVLFFSVRNYDFQGLAEIAQTLDAADAAQLGQLLDAYYGIKYYEDGKKTELHMVRYRVKRLFSRRKFNLWQLARVAGIGPQYPIFD